MKQIPVSAITSGTVTVVIRGMSPRVVVTTVFGWLVDTITGNDVVTSVHIEVRCQQCYVALLRNKHVQFVFTLPAVSADKLCL